MGHRGARGGRSPRRDRNRSRSADTGFGDFLGVEAFRDCSGLTAVVIRVSEAEGDYPDFSSPFPDGVPVEYQTLLLTINLALVSI